MSKMIHILQPKFLLVALILLVSWSKGSSFANASPIPDLDDLKDRATNFWDRAGNTFSDPTNKSKEHLTTTEIVLIAVAAFVVFMFLLCCIGYCLCECIKELICCICCCCRN